MIVGSLSDHAKDEIEAAQSALAEAELLLKNERYGGAISRAYYAIFHAARAVLNVHDSAPKTHKGVVSEFGRLLVVPGKVEEEYSKILREAREEREAVDYEVSERELLPTPEMARGIVINARKFVETMDQIIAREME